MVKPVDISIKIEELRATILQYGGMPSQVEDKAAYSNIKYYIEKYPDVPEVKALIEEFNLSIKKYNKDKQSQIAEIKKLLKERKAMPHSSKEKALYGYVKDFFKRYKDDAEIEKLKYQYAGPSCFPLKESAYSKCPNTDWDSYTSGIWKKWKSDAACEYIVYVWRRFGILPAENTNPMKSLKQKLYCYCKYSGKKSSQDEIDSLFAFSKLMEEFGCEDKTLCSYYHFPEFDTEVVQQRVRDMVIENGSCAIKYIAEMAIPNVSLPVEFVYYYYYNCAHYREDYWTIRPLGFIYVIDGDYGQFFLRVHFRDYYKCEVDRIRKSAQAHYRNWSENPPKSIEDWKYFGQWGLFVDDYGYKEGSLLKLLCDDWSETIIDHAFKISERYFYLYDRYKYLDYILFLLENDYSLYSSQVTDWVQGYPNYKGYTQGDDIIRQKVKLLLEQKGINLKELNEYGSI